MLAAVIGLFNNDVILLRSLRSSRCVRHFVISSFRQFVNSLCALRWLNSDLEGGETAVGTQSAGRWIEDSAQRVVEGEVRVLGPQTLRRQQLALDADLPQRRHDVRQLLGPGLVHCQQAILATYEPSQRQK